MCAFISLVACCLLNLPLSLGTKHSVERNVATHQTDYDSIRIPEAYELFSFADSVIGVHGYKQAVDLLGKYESSYSDPMEKSMFNQVMMTYLSYNGDIKAAQKYEARLSPKKQLENYSFSENLVIEPAKTVIIKRSANKQVVMFNEAHHRPQQRAFIRSLLEDFYSLGFRTLFVEAYFENQDSLLNERGYPLQNTGTYTKEPAFGEMLREAKRLGFTIASYDNDTAACESSEPFVCANQREKVSAENLFNFLKANPKAKILVAAGYAHIVKKSDDGWIKMAEQFKNLSGIDPLSIDLVSMGERLTKEHENKFYRAAHEKFKVTTPSIILDKTTQDAFLANYRPEQIDLQVVFPRTQYTNGYADWLSSGYQKVINVNLSKMNYKTGDLLQVYIKSELEAHNKQAVPILQHPLSGIQQQKLMLPSGYTYQIVIDHGITKSTADSQ
ncbi:hypothetical protein [Dyadobacter fanqingshengii]|uniref:Uncharacterized protein n=1 Tax=Dyadobacter fanqingshengii TaxID=2906443 RepID=A0A9X1T901_9BACT|nr:hypothetical protein [Dyadobacter fanqingshengii]MCF0040098.1 hypothetical protein [Dyadobacter fanqingshengii]USJ38150.1 hypothetical protein NFI81_10265 [Dyadobacter fanqingshengii]